MAEFALGLTKTAVEGTLSKVKSAIEEEAQLKERVQNDLVFITGEFQMMQSFLNVANTERAKNKVVQTWVRQLRDLAFDVEDCVDFVVHLDNKSTWSWLWRRVVPSCMAPPLPLDVAVAEIKQLKARVEDVSQRNTRYNLISDSGSSSSSKPLVSPSPAEQPVTASISPFNILNEVWGAAGKKCGTRDLKRLINSEGSDLQVISVWGTTRAADIGATRIIWEAYNDPEICQGFKNRAWVKLMRPFNPEKFLKSLLTQFNVGAVDFRKKVKAAVAMEDELMQQVSEQRYLVILEELSTPVEWGALIKYLPHGRNGSRIVVSTQQLRLAVSCIGEAYQVSDLSDGQSFCAFFNKVPGRRIDMGELSWQLTCGGVISVWGPARDGKSTLVHKVYTCIMHKSKEFEGVEFKQHSWVDAPDPFNLNVFARLLFLKFHSVDFRVKEIAAVGRMGAEGVIEGCRRFLCQDDCLVVINGLKSTDDWDLIKGTFLSEPTKGSSIVVITDEASVATYCAVEKDRTFNAHDLEADAVLRQSIKGCQSYPFRRQKGDRFFSNRMEEARYCTHRFDWSVSWFYLEEHLRDPGVLSLRRPAGCGKSRFVRRVRGVYYEQMLIVRQDGICRSDDMEFTAFSWVDVPHPFDLADFSWDLFLDFLSNDPKAKEAAAVRLMEGQDPIQGCLLFLHHRKCFVIINGIRSTYDWDLIRTAFLSEPIKSCIVVITNEASVATHCVDSEDKVLSKETLSPFIEDEYRDDSDEEEAPLRDRVFSDRMEEAYDWMIKIEPAVHLDEWGKLSGCLQDPGVISVWGIAGVGKSALVKSTYYNRMLGLRHRRGGSEFSYGEDFTAFSWVNVSHPFNLTEFSWRLLLDSLSDDPKAKENATFDMMEGQDPIQGCRKFLHQQKCFVVINGMRSTDDWDLIRAAFLSEPTKSCIVVITNEASVATHCVDSKDKVVNIKGLEADVALRLFKKIAWGGKQLTPEETTISKLTMDKCGGLSKVIAAIGEQCSKNYSAANLLKEINCDFMSILESDPIFHSLRGLFSWMQSYFDACSDSLKPCIFYLSVFPADHKVRRKRLLRRWIAEGYSRDNFRRTAEEEGEMLFSKLVKLSIIQETPRKVPNHRYLGRNQPSKVDVCKVNGFFHEYIMSRPMEDNLVFALEGRCRPNSQHTGQHLTVRESWDRDKIVFESIDFTRLRSLTVFGEWRSFFISKSMRLLRVLDLEDTPGVTDNDLEQIGKLLGRLKFLSLRGCIKITRLPNSLCGMRQLQTLDVKGTSIVTLPANITKLQKLQYIRAGTTMSSEAAADDLWTSSTPPEADGDGTVDTSVAAADDLPTSSAPPGADGDGTVDTSVAAAIGLPTSSTPPEANGDGTVPPSPWSSSARDLVSSWLSNIKLRRRRNGGVEVPTGIGKLTTLHTLGVINVSGAGGKKVILRELKKLTQLRKLRVSGINRENWQDLCDAISGHGHLESLSLRLDEGVFACSGDISSPPSTLKSLKLYGNGPVSPLWIMQLRKLRKANFELTLSTQEDIDTLVESPHLDVVRGLCVKPIQDGQLRFSWRETWRGNIFNFTVLKIDCSYRRLEIVFRDVILSNVELLVVHCSSGSSLELSGLKEMWRLKKVLLRGSYGDAVKQHLEQKLSEHPNEPVLKLEEKPRSS